MYDAVTGHLTTKYQLAVYDYWGVVEGLLHVMPVLRMSRIMLPEAVLPGRIFSGSLRRVKGSHRKLSLLSIYVFLRHLKLD